MSLLIISDWLLSNEIMKCMKRIFLHGNCIECIFPRLKLGLLDGSTDVFIRPKTKLLVLVHYNRQMKQSSKQKDLLILLVNFIGTSWLAKEFQIETLRLSFQGPKLHFIPYRRTIGNIISYTYLNKSICRRVHIRE